MTTKGWDEWDKRYAALEAKAAAFQSKGPPGEPDYAEFDRHVRASMAGDTGAIERARAASEKSRQTDKARMEILRVCAETNSLIGEALTLGLRLRGAPMQITTEMEARVQKANALQEGLMALLQTPLLGAGAFR